MENISKKDIDFRLENIKSKACQISEKIDKNNEEFEAKFKFAKNIGIKIDKLNNTNNIVKDNLNKYVEKVDEILTIYNNLNEEKEEEYKVLNNMLYLDDIKLKNINDMISENKDLTTREYINLFANKANDLIRVEEMKYLEKNMNKYSKISLLEKLTGKAKIKKVMFENYNLKMMETINKKYIPNNKSLYEIVSIANNCGYKSKELELFVNSIVDEFKLDKLQEGSLLVISKDKKIPMFYNKEFFNKINAENAYMLNNINKRNKNKVKVSEYKMYNDMLINDVSTLELFNFNGKI